MVRRARRGSRYRVLLVTGDDAFSGAVKIGLPGVDLMSLTESSVWTAIRAGLDVTRGIDALIMDCTIGGLLQLRLYERLRPSDVVARVPVVFVRGQFGGGPAHDLDFYLPPDGTPDQAARLVSHVLGVPYLPPRIAARLGGDQAAAVVVGQRARRSQPAAVPPGLLQKLGLWGVGAALLGFTFWPVVGSAPVREAFQAPFAAFGGGDIVSHVESGR